MTGTVTVNGVPVTDEDVHASVYLKSGSGGHAPIARSLQEPFSAVVIPGTYDLYYSSSAGAGIPTNAQSRFRRGIVVSDSPLSLDLDVPGTTVSGSVTVNGSPITEEYYNFGMLELRDPDGSRARLSFTNPPGDAYSTWW